MRCKHTFTPAERFGLFRAHNGKCFWCNEPIIFADVTIDHILPEKLQDNEEKLEQVKSEYSLPETFNINSFENWVPAHGRCNSSKGDTVYDSSPAMIKALFDAKRRAPLAQKVKEEIENDIKNKSKVIATIQEALDKKTISIDEITSLLPAVDSIIKDQKEQIKEEIPEEIRITEHWSVLTRATRDFGPRIMYKTKCSICGREADVPFKPSLGKDVYCKDCFKKRRVEGRPLF